MKLKRPIDESLIDTPFKSAKVHVKGPPDGDDEYGSVKRDAVHGEVRHDKSPGHHHYLELAQNRGE